MNLINSHHKNPISRQMLSFWEKKNFLKHDLIVIGGGIVGLSTAIQYKELFPERKVLVLERGLFPSGASSKNAGFACFGSLTEILDDLEVLPKEEVVTLVKRRYDGLLAIREKFGDAELEFREDGGFELITDKELSAMQKLEEINELLYPIFNQFVFSALPSHGAFGFGPKVKAVVKNAFEGELDSGKFINTLWQTSSKLGVKILTGARVSRMIQEEGILEVDGFGEKIHFRASQLALCTNAFTSSFLPDMDLRPGRGLVMVTAPLPYEIPWKGAFHYDKGYVYFRNIDNRLLLGGGRNIDFEGEETVDFGINPNIKRYLLEIMKEVIFPNSAPKIETEWSGIMAFGADKRPIVKTLTPNVAMAVRLGGMGVAIGWQTASELVNLLSEA
ncbi:NAD(P)/FAD-dependent oxidoreductase [Cecembia lonarensis]|nr:FAD-dependent oxidoreductase [Cecembia lonarensis]